MWSNRETFILEIIFATFTENLFLAKSNTQGPGWRYSTQGTPAQEIVLRPHTIIHSIALKLPW